MMYSLLLIPERGNSSTPYAKIMVRTMLLESGGFGERRGKREDLNCQMGGEEGGKRATKVLVDWGQQGRC